MSKKQKKLNVLEDSKNILEYIYSKIPETKGCMKHINAKPPVENCGGVCCQLQNPQVLYSEFMNSWKGVVDDWEDNDITDLIERCLKAYLFEEHRQGCVFWDSSTKLCLQHRQRPYNCRIYGITSEEEWKPRYESLKILYPETRDQCNLVSTVDGSKFTKEKSDKLWAMLNNAEKMLGIKEEDIHDGFGGSYRHYYEHFLIHIMGDDGMIMLSQIREHGSQEEKLNIIKLALEGMSSFKGKSNESEDQGSEVSGQE